MKEKSILKKVLAIAMIAVISLLSTGCGKKKEETPFFEKYEFEIVDKDKTYELPIYFYSQDGDGNLITVDGLEFVPNKMKYEFVDWTKSTPDEDGNVTISFTYKMNTELEYRLPKTNTVEWYYNYYYNNPFAFDYYTGEMYKSTTVSNLSKTYMNGLEQVDEEMQYTEITWNGKKTKVGSISYFTFDGWKDKETIDDEEGYYHYKTPISASMTTELKVPEDYDGLMIAINKNGATKESFDEDMELINRMEELKKQADEVGEKSDELVEIEENIKKTHKLIDENDKDRKDMKPEDYYIIKVNDMFK